MKNKYIYSVSIKAAFWTCRQKMGSHIQPLGFTRTIWRKDHTISKSDIAEPHYSQDMVPIHNVVCSYIPQMPVIGSNNR